MKRKYPWEEWLSRRHTFRLKKGVDFDSAIHSMSVQIRQAAAERGKRVSVFIVDDTLMITVKSHA